MVSSCIMLSGNYATGSPANQRKAGNSSGLSLTAAESDVFFKIRLEIGKLLPIIQVKQI